MKMMSKLNLILIFALLADHQLYYSRADGQRRRAAIHASPTAARTATQLHHSGASPQNIGLAWSGRHLPRDATLGRCKWGSETRDRQGSLSSFEECVHVCLARSRLKTNENFADIMARQSAPSQLFVALKKHWNFTMPSNLRQSLRCRNLVNSMPDWLPYWGWLEWDREVKGNLKAENLANLSSRNVTEVICWNIDVT